MNYKWILAFAPLIMVGCEDKIYEPEVPIASSGDDVLFSISNSPSSRTMYQDDWEETESQKIFWETMSISTSTAPIPTAALLSIK